MGNKLVIQPADEFRDRSVANHFVHNIVAPLLAGDPEKLRVSARKDVLRAFAQNEEAPDSRRRVVDGNDHLGRGKTLIGAALVRGECRRVNREGKVFLLKTPQIEVGDTCRTGRGRIEVLIAMPAFLIQNPFVLPGPLNQPIQ